MDCGPLPTGNQFLSAALAHVDCQARAIGAYGYGALANPGSAVSIALTGLLTIFIALFGIRLLLGDKIGGRDVIGDVLKVGIVLTIASSWPAWRTVGYDFVLNGPREVASAIGIASGLPGSRNDMLARLQNADDGIVALTVFGSGRLTGDVATGTDIGDSPRGIAVGDQFALGTGRTLFLASTIGSIALTRLGAGILLAIAPLMAGLLFLSGTASIFFGWLRALAFCALGNVMLLVVQGTELSLLYPWLNDVLQQRASRVFTPSAPTELLVLTLGFSALTVGLLVLTAKLTFMPALPRLRLNFDSPEFGARRALSDVRSTAPPSRETDSGLSRAHMVSEAVSRAMRQESQLEPVHRPLGPAAMGRAAPSPAASPVLGHVVGPSDSLGSAYRRTHRRSSAAAQRRSDLR